MQGLVEGHLTFASETQSVFPLGRYISAVKLLEGEQSVFLAFYAGAKNAHVGQI